MIIIDKPYPKSCYDCWIRLNMGCKKAYYEGYPDDKKSKDCPISVSSKIYTRDKIMNDFESWKNAECPEWMDDATFNYVWFVYGIKHDYLVIDPKSWSIRIKTEGE